MDTEDNHRRLSSLLLAAALLPATVATAQVATEEAVQDREFEEEIFVEGSAGTAATSSRVATKVDLPLRLTPASVGVVTEALSREQNNGVLSDALRNVSGVNVQTQSGVHDYFVVRGFDSLSAGLILTDGIAEPEATYYHLYNVERVEVLKGPGSFLYGGNPLAATVNLIRRQPSPETSWSVAVGAGSFATQRVRFDLNLDPDSAVGFRISGQWSESDGFRDDKSSETFAVNPAFRFEVNESSVVHLNIELVSNEYSPDSGLPVSGAMRFDLPRKRSYQSPFDFSDQEITRLRANWETVVGSDVTLRNKAHYTDLDWLSAGTIFAGVAAFPFVGELLFRAFIPLDDEQIFYGDQFEVTWSTDKHQMLFGIEVIEQTDEFTIDVGFLPAISLFSPLETATRPVPLDPRLREMGNVKTTILASYFQDRALINDHFQIFWGARLDVLDVSDRLRGQSLETEELSPMLGAIYAPSDQQSWYLNFGQSFAAPSTRVSGSLQPEESRQVELGFKGRAAGGRVHTGVSVYHLERDNIAIFDANGFTAQTGSQESRGIEIDVAGTLRNGFRFQMSGAYNEAELTEFNEVFFLPPTFFPVILDRSGNTPAFAPETLVNVWVAKNFRSGFGIAGGGRSIASQFIAADNVFEIDSAFVADLALFYELERWRLSVNFSNVTDEAYFLRGFGASSVIPAEGSSVFLEVELRN